MNKIENVRKALINENLDCYLVTDVKNIYYLTGFLDVSSATLRMLIPREGNPILFVTSLSFEAASSQACNCNIEAVTLGESANNRLLKELKKTSVKTMGYDTLQLETYLTLSKNLGTQLFEKAEIMANQRRVKNVEEVSMIKQACDMADAGMEAATEAIRQGAKEYEVAAQAEYAMRMLGSMGVAFETLVASGPRSAFPHGISSDRQMRSGEFVIVDLGATWKGYCSDLTRTFVVGKASPKDLRIVKKVKEAHDKALDKIRPKVEASKIDTVARTALGTSLAANFVHGLGHGVGLSIHEAPTISQISKDILEAGNVVTDEPGVYIHGYGGVRIEDVVLVINKGCKKLTNSPYLQLG